MIKHNDSDERIYLEGLDYIFKQYLFLPLLAVVIVIFLMAFAGCVLREINGV